MLGMAMLIIIMNNLEIEKWRTMNGSSIDGSARLSTAHGTLRTKNPRGKALKKSRS
jgi:hypothetical protein